MIFGQELAALLKAGLPLFQSLDVMLERQRDPVFRRSLTAVRDKVKSGVALSEAFRAEGDLYPPIFAASLVAGERSGSLETVLRRFVQHLRLNQALKKKAIAASVYPAVLLVTMMGLIVILLVFVIPNFKSFFEGMGAELPLPTRVLMAVGQRAARQRRSSSPWGVVGAGRCWPCPGGGARDRAWPSTASCCACPTSGPSSACTPRASSRAPCPPCSPEACPC